MGYAATLRQRHLATLWVSQVLSAIGDNLYTIAVIWIAVQVAGGGAGVVAAAQSLSALAFGLLGGVYADRWNRRATMIGVDLLRGAAVLLLPLLAHAGALRFWHLIAVAVVIGGLGALFDPALQASLPALTGDTRTLQSTNSLMDVTRRLARALGPSLVGLLVALLPLIHFFTLDAISFGISALAVFSLGRRWAWTPERSAHAGRGIRGVVSEIAGAARLVRAHRPLTWALAGNFLVNASWSIAFTVGAALFAKQVLTEGVGTYGLIVGAYGVGNVVSNVVMGSVVVRRRVAVLFTGRLVLGAGFLILAFARSLPVALGGSALAAVGGPMGDITLLMMMQSDFPANQIGKIYSLRMTIASAGISLGLLLAGPLYAGLSVPLVIAFCATVMLATGVAGLARFGFTEPPVPLPVAPKPSEQPDIAPIAR